MGSKTCAQSKTGVCIRIYHQFYNSPYHFIAIQQLVKWIYPEEFEDLDPDATFVKLHDRFMPFDAGGQFWLSLP